MLTVLLVALELSSGQAPAGEAGPLGGTAPVLRVGTGVGLRARSGVDLQVGAGVRHRLLSPGSPGWSPVGTALLAGTFNPGAPELWGEVRLGLGRYAGRLPGVPVFEAYALGGRGVAADGHGWRAGFGLSLNLLPVVIPLVENPRRPAPPPPPPLPPRIEPEASELPQTPPPLVEAPDPGPAPPPPPPEDEPGPPLSAGSAAHTALQVGLGAVLVLGAPLTIYFSEAFWTGLFIALYLPVAIFYAVIYGIAAYLIASTVVGIAVSLPYVEVVWERTPGEAAPRPRLMFGISF